MTSIDVKTVNVPVVAAANVGPPGAPGPQGDPGAKGNPGNPGLPGPPGLVWRNNWQASQPYDPHDAVRYLDGTSYVCWLTRTPTATPPPDDPQHWNVLAQAGAEGPQGPEGAQGADGAPGGGASQMARDPYYWLTAPGIVAGNATIVKKQMYWMPFDVPFPCQIEAIGASFSNYSASGLARMLLFEDYQGLPGDCINVAPDLVTDGQGICVFATPTPIESPVRVWPAIHNVTGSSADPSIAVQGAELQEGVMAKPGPYSSSFCGLKRSNVEIADSAQSMRGYDPPSVADFFFPQARFWVKCTPLP